MIPSPPTQQPLVDKNGAATLMWMLFFNGMFEGDAGEDWTPTLANLTEVGGAATKSGRLYQINQNLVYFTATITPVTNTSSTAGTTYINNFPLTLAADAACLAVAGNVGLGAAGHIVASNNRIYTPAWATITTPVTVIGLAAAR
jgi:hypothetical protein